MHACRRAPTSTQACADMHAHTHTFTKTHAHSFDNHSQTLQCPIYSHTWQQISPFLPPFRLFSVHPHTAQRSTCMHVHVMRHTQANTRLHACAHIHAGMHARTTHRYSLPVSRHRPSHSHSSPPSWPPRLGVPVCSHSRPHMIGHICIRMYAHDTHAHLRDRTNTYIRTHRGGEGERETQSERKNVCKCKHACTCHKIYTCQPLESH